MNEDEKVALANVRLAIEAARYAAHICRLAGITGTAAVHEMTEAVRALRELEKIIEGKT